MPRYKFNKSTLIVASMVILLCLVALTGATFALFTWSTGDGTIGINATSGNLKVDIVDTSPDKPQTLVGDVLMFVTTNANDKVYFEPGAAFRTEGFRIENEGNVPINYILYISDDNSGEYKFADAFEVFITTNPDAKTNVEDLQRFDGSLEPNGLSEIYYLVVRMKETAGNEFQNRLYSGIGITVCAVQGNVEID